MLSQQRDLAAAAVGHKPRQVTTDGHTACPRAIRETQGQRVERTVYQGCLGNQEMEQESSRCQAALLPDAGIQVMVAAGLHCRPFDEVRNYFRPRAEMGEEWPWSQRRERFVSRYLRLQEQFCLI